MEEWKEEIDKIIEEKHGKFKRGEIKQLFETLANKYNISIYTVKNYYYRRPAEEDKKSQPRNVFKLEPGDVVEVIIKEIVHYGVFVEPVKSIYKTNYKGLIHISEITTKEFVEDPGEYFKIGDIVKARVKKIEDNGRVAYTTKDLGIHHLSPPAADEKSEGRNHAEGWDNAEKEVLHYLQDQVGAISPKAKQMLREMFDRYGSFKTTASIVLASRDFEDDLGVLLLEKANTVLRSDSL